MLWQTWHRELGGGEQLGSGGGGCTRRSCGRGSPSGDRSRLGAAAAGMARVVPAWLLLPLAVWVVLPTWLSSAKFSSLIERISDPKDLKKLLRTRNNVLVLYSKSEAAAESHLKLLSTVAQAVKGQGTICWVDCGDAESRKLCKKMKVDLSAKDKKVELFHYQDGAFHTEYNRAVTFKSIVAFLKDPKGPPLWEEDPGAKDVVHIDNEKDFRRLLKKEEKPILMMFYAPWCSVCKRIMPHFQKAATQLRGQFVASFPPCLLLSTTGSSARLSPSISPSVHPPSEKRPAHQPGSDPTQPTQRGCCDCSLISLIPQLSPYNPQELSGTS